GCEPNTKRESFPTRRRLAAEARAWSAHGGSVAIERSDVVRKREGLGPPGGAHVGARFARIGRAPGRSPCDHGGRRAPVPGSEPAGAVVAGAPVGAGHRFDADRGALRGRMDEAPVAEIDAHV